MSNAERGTEVMKASRDREMQKETIVYPDSCYTALSLMMMMMVVMVIAMMMMTEMMMVKYPFILVYFNLLV